MSEHSHDHGHGDDHGHVHPHGDGNGHARVPEATHGPSPAASVILELSEHIGALIIDAAAEQTGVEIEISRAGAEIRTHSMVRERITEPTRQYSAVYPSLEAGEYTIWHETGDPAGKVTVRGGQVTRFALTG
jgi:hypothetical protein